MCEGKKKFNTKTMNNFKLQKNFVKNRLKKTNTKYFIVKSF